MNKHNLTNYHSHCDMCDGHAPMERFVEEAVACGMSAYGITSHTTFPVGDRSLQPHTYPLYFTETARLREHYRNKIELYVGLEIDYIDEERNPASAIYRDMPTDYTIGSVHFIPTNNGEWMCVDGAYNKFRERMQHYFGDDIREIVTRFYRQSSNLIRCGHFTMHGHPDKIALNASQFQADITTEPWYEEMAVSHLRSLAGGDFLVELNTKAWEEHKRLFPSVELLPLVKKLGLRLVVNSDCHYPDKVNSGRYEALQILRQAGIDTVWELHNRRWQEVSIGI